MRFASSRRKPDLMCASFASSLPFRQDDTPTGTMLAHGFIATIEGGELLVDGPEGPAKAYPLDGLPAIVPVRVANRRALDEYLRQRYRAAN